MWNFFHLLHFIGKWKLIPQCEAPSKTKINQRKKTKLPKKGGFAESYQSAIPKCRSAVVILD